MLHKLWETSLQSTGSIGVTESKFILLAPNRPINPERSCWGKTLFRKPGDREDGRPCVSKNQLAQVRILSSFILKVCVCVCVCVCGGGRG